MIDRYQSKQMKDLWSDENKFKVWLDIEILNCYALYELGLVTKEELTLIDKAGFDLEQIREIELETRHDVVAFTRSVSTTLGNEAKWIHYGLTSTDIVDTAYGSLFKQANDIISDALDGVVEKIATLASKHRDTVMMGRTHGVHAELTTFGFKMAVFYEEFKRHQERFAFARRDVEAGKISGAVGTYANVDPFVETYVCEKLGIEAAPISTQVLQRDRHAHYMSVIALIGDSLEKLAVEFRHLQRTEVNEAREGFAKGQKGSSAMPHKKNPITSENIAGLSRVLRGYMVTSHENVALWHERDISHSSTERIIMPDATSLIEYMLNKMAHIIENLEVQEENMLNNIRITNNVFFAQRVLTSLISKGLTREEAYDLVQPVALFSLENRQDFKVDITPKVSVYLSTEEIDECFVTNYHLPQIKNVFERLGL